MSWKFRKRMLAAAAKAPESVETEQPASVNVLSRELPMYQGHWVAVYENQVVALGSSAAEVQKVGHEKQITERRSRMRG